jgi:hypothetical protein
VLEVVVYALACLAVVAFVLLPGYVLLHPIATRASSVDGSPA